MSTYFKSRIWVITLVLGMGLLLVACLGPKPVLQSYNVERPPAGSDQPFKVEAVIHNQGPGAGQVSVMVVLENKQTGETIRQEEKDVVLDNGETQHVFFEMDLPISAKNMDPNNIDVHVDTHYPIE